MATTNGMGNRLYRSPAAHRAYTQKSYNKQCHNANLEQELVDALLSKVVGQRQAYVSIQVSEPRQLSLFVAFLTVVCARFERHGWHTVLSAETLTDDWCDLGDSFTDYADAPPVDDDAIDFIISSFSRLVVPTAAARASPLPKVVIGISEVCNCDDPKKCC
jgi:hypothetical protein